MKTPPQRCFTRFRLLVPLLSLLSFSLVENVAWATAAPARAPLGLDRPPTITAQPQNQTVVLGGTATLSVEATGTLPLFYQWRRNVFGAPVNFPGATNAALIFAPVQRTNDGTYSVIVANAAGSTTSVEARLTVLLPPTIMVQPQSRTAPLGGGAFFTVWVAGTGPYQFQWFFNGSERAGATNRDLIVDRITLADAGKYSVRVSNAYGSAMSAEAQLIVAGAPQITTQPQDLKVPIGATATFSVTAIGTAALRYQWRFDEGDLPNATNASHVVAEVQFADTGLYAVRISNAGGSITSTNARLSLDVAAEAPTITRQPLSQPVAAGADVTLTVAATGTPQLQYQWRLNGRDLIGATNEFLALTNFQSADAGAYTARVSNAAGGTSSTVAQLTLLGPPKITEQPKDRAITAGSDYTLRVTATGVGPFQYQWRFNGSDIPGATRDQFDLRNFQSVNAGVYSVQVTGPGGSVTSADARVTVYDPIAFPKVTWLPHLPMAAIGTNVTLEVAASGAPPLQFQWLRNGRELPGATHPTLVLSNVQVSDAGLYGVKVSNAAGTVTSPTMPLMIVASGPTLSQSGFVIRAGGPPGASFRLQATSDMKTWTTLIRMTFTEQPIEFLDTDAPNHPGRFYRALIGP